MRNLKHVLVALLVLAPATWASAESLGELPPNLAQQATIVANSQHGHLPAVNVADGRIVGPLVMMGEMGSWAVVGDETQKTGEITFTWQQQLSRLLSIYYLSEKIIWFLPVCKSRLTVALVPEIIHPILLRF